VTSALRPSTTGPPTVTTLVVVDNHPTMRRGVEALALEHPTEFSIAGSYGDVTEIDFQHDPAPDVVVLDLRLGRDDVLSTPSIPALRAWGAKVLLHTSEESPVLLRGAVSAGANGLVLKSDRPESLREALLAIHSEEYVVSSALAQALLEDPHITAELTPREVEILQAVDDGLGHKQIASRLGISTETVKSHLNNACQKFRDLGREVTNTVSVVKMARKDGWLGG
jgi:DNA-binding NarL/FixJ family response regulator